jgi:hypothetical protein
MNKQAVYSILLIVILIIILCVQQCSISNLKTDAAMNDINAAALKDTIKEVENKLGKTQFEKSVLIASKNGLKDLNADLAAEVNAQKGKIAYLSKIAAGISTNHNGPQIIIPIPHSSNANPCDSIASFNLPWNNDKQYDINNWRKLNGNSSFIMNKGIITSASNEIKQDEIAFDIVTGLEKKDDHYEIFIRSNYPGFKPTKIDGAFIPQKDLFPPQAKQKWSVGPTFSGGLGACFTPSGLQPAIYVGVGLGISYKFFGF